MTKENLGQLQSLKREISLIEDRVKQKRSEYNEICAEHHPTTDTVQGSSRSWPYCLHTMTVEGVSAEITDARAKARHELSKTIAQLLGKKSEYEREEQRLNEFISNVTDSRIRQILTLRYAEGLAWPNIAAKMGCEESEDSVRKTAKRFLENS